MAKNKIIKRGILNGNWKGDNVGYFGMHRWVEYHKPKPKFCEHCNKRPPQDLSNKSGKYKRDLNDYEWLCRKCHMIVDGRARPYKPCLRCKKMTRNKYYCSSKCSINEDSKKKDNLFFCPGCKCYLNKKEFNKGSHKYGIGTYCKNCLNKRYLSQRLWVQIPSGSLLIKITNQPQSIYR